MTTPALLEHFIRPSRRTVRRLAPPAPWTAAGLITLLAAGLWLTQLHDPGATMEEGFMLALPLRVLHGAVPEQAFQFFYGPLALWIPAVAYAVLGASLAVERAVGAAYLTVLAVALYLLGARNSRILGAVLAVLTLVLGQFAGDTGGLTALPLTGALGAASVAILVATGPGDHRGRDVASGVLFGVAADLRPEYALVGLVALAALLALGLRRRVAVLAFALSLLPYAMLVALAGWSNVWQILVVETLRLPAERHLPLLTAGRTGVLAVLIVFGGAVGATLWIIWRHRRSPVTATAVLLVLLTAVAAADFAQRSDLFHLESFLTVLIPVAVWLSWQLWLLPGRRWRVPALAGVALAGLAGFAAVKVDQSTVRSSLSAFVDGAPEYVVNNAGRTWIYYSPETADAAEQIATAADQIAAQHPGVSLFVGTADLRQTTYTDNSFYYLLPQFVQRSHFYDFYPGIALYQGNALARNVRSADVLILTAEYFDEPNLSSRVGSDAANAVVQSEFRVILSAGPYTLYERG